MFYVKRFKYIFFILLLLLLILVVMSNSTIFEKIIFPLKYEEYVYKYAGENNIDPYIVFAIIKAESNFDPDATSRKDAKGLMQITDKTGAWGAERIGMTSFISEDLYNPEINIRIGCWYIHQLMKEFDSNIDLMIAAYNGGSGNVTEWLKDKELSAEGKSLKKIPFKETDSFLKKVKSYHSAYRKLYAKEQKE